MEITDLLDSNNVIANFRPSSKKQTLQTLARQLSKSTGLDANDVFTALLARESLGSTGVGKGVGIPHARIKGLDEIQGLFARLVTPVNFDSVDDRPVDLIFLLLAPEDAGADHLKALAKVSRLLRDDKTCAKLRATEDNMALFAMLTETAAKAA